MVNYGRTEKCLNSGNWSLLPRQTRHYILHDFALCRCICTVWKCKTYNLIKQTRIDRESSISERQAFAAQTTEPRKCI